MIWATMVFLATVGITTLVICFTLLGIDGLLTDGGGKCTQEFFTYATQFHFYVWIKSREEPGKPPQPGNHGNDRDRGRMREFSTGRGYTDEGISRMEFADQTRKLNWYSWKDEQQIVDHCEVIHIAIICRRPQGTKHVANLLKSILLHRVNPLHLYFIMNSTDSIIVNTLMTTWNIAEVTWSTHEPGTHAKLKRWLKRDYSLITMHMSWILQKTEKVILMNADYLVHTDIAELWAVFNQFSEEQVIGITGRKISPSDNKDQMVGIYDFGVSLLRLREFRERNLVPGLQVDLKVASSRMTVFRFREEKDMLETVFQKREEMIFFLPCKWNILLQGDGSCSSGKADEFKIINWSSVNSDVPHMEYFRSLRQAILDTSGNLLTLKAKKCFQKRELEVDSPQDYLSTNICDSYSEREDTQYRTQIFFTGRPRDSEDNQYEVTLVSHLNSDRLPLLKNMAKRWLGPMSLSVYLTDREVGLFEETLKLCEAVCARQNIVYHIVYKETSKYPVNYLRNLAFNHASSGFVFLTDFEDLPMKGLYGLIKINLLRNGGKHLDRTVLVIPTYRGKYATRRIPQTTEQLLLLVRNGEFSVLHHVFPEQTGKSPQVSYQSPKPNWKQGYEPGLVVPKTAPRYRRVYREDLDKMVHIIQLHATGHKFVPVRDAFLVNLPYLENPVEKDRLRGKLETQCRYAAMQSYMKNISARYHIPEDDLLEAFPDFRVDSTSF